MINIKTLHIRNFLSYGDYETTLSLSELGPVLITGEVDEDKDRSNGSGKTTIVEAIVWCLFGRFTDKDNPGDNVMNWFNDGNCKVCIETKDDYKITRMRSKGQTNIIIKKGDEDLSASTPTHAQTLINSIFNIDFATFSTSILFGQFSKSFLDLSDTKRRDAIEKIMHLVGFDVYIKISKTKLDEANSEQGKDQVRVEELEDKFKHIVLQQKENLQKSNNFEDGRKTKMIETDRKIVQVEERFNNEKTNLEIEIKNELEKIKNVDLDGVDKAKTIWAQIEKVELAIVEKEKSILKLDGQLEQITKNAKRKEDEIDTWKLKSGKTCFNCKQIIADGHICDIVSDEKKELDELDKSKESIKEKRKSIKSAIFAVREKISKKKPKQSLDHCLEKEKRAEEYGRTVISCKKEIDGLEDKKKDQIEIYKEQFHDIKSQNNPFSEINRHCDKDKIEVGKKILENRNKVKKSNVLIKHLSYINTSYRDKKKFRAFLLNKSIPYLNEKIKFYLNSFGCNIDLSFNNLLKVDVDKWPLMWHSGGEKKRISLVLMFSIHDLHEMLFGRQCNLLILDEIDGSLDKKGVDKFIEVLYDCYVNSGNGPETIFVISHKDTMRDAFPTKINIKKKEEFSYIEEII